MSDNYFCGNGEFKFRISRDNRQDLVITMDSVNAEVLDRIKPLIARNILDVVAPGQRRSLTDIHRFTDEVIGDIPPEGGVLPLENVKEWLSYVSP